MLYDVATWLIPLVIAIVFHEVAHGLVARTLGDRTAADAGRLTLNPIRHVDPVGTVLLPMVLAVAHAPIFGWAKPVPVSYNRLRHPRSGMVLVALAGPGMNLLLAAIATLALAGIMASNGFSIGIGAGAARFIVDNLLNFLLINVFLAIFNLIPLPPFDGGHVVEGALPRSAVPAWHRLARFGFPIMLVLLVVVPSLFPHANVVAKVIGPFADGVVSAMLGLIGIHQG